MMWHSLLFCLLACAEAELLFVEFAVANSLRLFNTEAFSLVHFVIRIVAIEEEHVAIAFKCKDMGANAVEEPAVVTDDHSTACKRFQTFLKRTERVYVNVVGRFVEQQHVALLLQRECQLQAVALTT